MRQLRLGHDSFASLVDRLVASACAIVPALGRDACRELIELILIVRTRATVACGHHPACGPGTGTRTGWRDPDLPALPAMFAACAADRAQVRPEERSAIEARLADGFRAELAALVFDHPPCGHAAICSATPIHPLIPHRRPPVETSAQSLRGSSRRSPASASVYRLQPRNEKENAMTVNNISAVRHVVGSSGQIVDEVIHAPPLGQTVATIMTRDIYCARPDVSLESLAAMLLEHSVSGIPVVDAHGHLVGMVSKTDLLRHHHDHREDKTETRAALDDVAMLAELGGGFHGVRIDLATVSDVMMPIAFSITPDVPIAKAAALMACERIHRLPVVDSTGAICGILSTLDIVSWVAAEAGYRL